MSENPPEAATDVNLLRVWREGPIVIVDGASNVDDFKAGLAAAAEMMIHDDDFPAPLQMLALRGWLTPEGEPSDALKKEALHGEGGPHEEEPPDNCEGEGG